jgi:hypothetical protein
MHWRNIVGTGEQPWGIDGIHMGRKKTSCKETLCRQYYPTRREAGLLGLKGHMIVVAQNISELANIFPLTISYLPDMIHVIWTGKEPLKQADLQVNFKGFTINKERVYDALVWLMENIDIDIDKFEFVA